MVAWQPASTTFDRYFAMIVTLRCLGAVSGCVDVDGNAYTWGYGAFWQLGTGSNADQGQPQQVGSSCSSGMCLLRNLVCCGHDSFTGLHVLPYPRSVDVAVMHVHYVLSALHSDGTVPVSRLAHHADFTDKSAVTYLLDRVFCVVM